METENKTGQTGVEKIYKKLLLKYMNIAYIIGERVDKKEFKKLSNMLYQADIQMTPGIFISMCVLTAFISAAVMFVISITALSFIFKSLMALPLAILISFVTFAAVTVAFPFNIINKINTKKIDTERDLPFALSYMSVLASAGSTPLKVISDTATQNYGYVSSEFGKMGYRVYFLGEDSITAINHLANNTSSPIFRDTCLDLSNIIRSGTGLSDYLAEKSTNLIDIKKISLKAFMDDIAMFAEMYVMVSLFIMLAITSIPIINIFGLEIASIDANGMFLIFTYFIVPLVNIIFIALLEVKYSSMP